VISLSLSPAEVASLEQTRRTTRSQVAERCHSILLTAAGCNVPQIAQRLERHEHTIRKWLKAYQRQGLLALYDTPSSGRPPTKSHEIMKQLEHLLESNPNTYGYLEAGWTVDLIRDYCRQHAMAVSDSTVRRCLQAGGWV
jgi:transposase